MSDLKGIRTEKKILITGGAGFIGFHLARLLLDHGCDVFSIDSLNDYYSVQLKHERLKILRAYPTFQFLQGEIQDKAWIHSVFRDYRPSIVVNLAAQAGVRYSIDCPDCYIQSNILGFYEILEACRHYPVDHLVYASSSSVYGVENVPPFSTKDLTDTPASLYAATKKSNELFAYAYNHLYNIPMTGLRFFTVYGPWGRPDMAYFSFAMKMLSGQAIQIFNRGKSHRDFTYVDDIVQAMCPILFNPPHNNGHKVYNIGANDPILVNTFIDVLESSLCKSFQRQMVFEKEYLPMQKGEVLYTHSDSSELARDFGIQPQTHLDEGLQLFTDWLARFYAENDWVKNDNLWGNG